jgi:hypothetical protein
MPIASEASAESSLSLSGTSGEAGPGSTRIVDSSFSAEQPGRIPDAKTTPDGTLEANGGPPLGSPCGVGGECVEGVPPMLMSHCNYADVIIPGFCGTGLVCCRLHTDPSYPFDSSIGGGGG